MRLRNDLNLNPEAFLLLSIYSEAVFPVGFDRSAAAYVKRFKKAIHATGQACNGWGSRMRTTGAH
jgi:hypothetical protein